MDGGGFDPSDSDVKGKGSSRVGKTACEAAPAAAEAGRQAAVAHGREEERAEEIGATDVACRESGAPAIQ